MVALMDTFLQNRWIVQPNQANMLDTAHGGNVMKWMDEVGALSAMRFAGETCVTARMSQVEAYFVYVAIDEDRKPVPVPDLEVETEEGETLREKALDGEQT